MKKIVAGLVSVAVILLAFSSAYLVDSIIGSKYTKKERCGVSKEVKGQGQFGHVLGRETLSYNVFGLFKNLPNPKEEKTEKVLLNSSFKGKLLGLILGKDVAYAVLKIGDNVTIIDNKSSNKKVRVLGVRQDGIVVDFNGKVYRLSFEGGITSSALKTSLNNNKGYEKVRIAKSYVEKNLKDINRLMRSVAVYPYYKNGDFVGYRIGNIVYNSLLWRIGLRGGDVVVRINGEKLDKPQQLLELFSNVANLNAVSVDYIRNGKKKTLLVELY